MSEKPVVGESWYGNLVLEVCDLSLEDWFLYKIPGNKSEDDFIVKVINPDHPRGISVQHAHFAVDLFGKVNNDPEDTRRVFEAVIDVWDGESVESVLAAFEGEDLELPGYDIEYILHAYNWILDQEDINYDPTNPRGDKKQNVIDESLSAAGIEKAPQREGSQLAIALMCDIMIGVHPVEALRKAGLEIKPRGWS